MATYKLKWWTYIHYISLTYKLQILIVKLKLVNVSSACGNFFLPIFYTLHEHFIRYLLDLFFRLSRLSAPVAFPLRGLMRCVFSDALLHTTVCCNV